MHSQDARDGWAVWWLISYKSIDSFEGTWRTKMRRSACGLFLRPVLANGRTAVRRTSTNGSRRCMQTSSRSFPKISFPSESPDVLECFVAHTPFSAKRMSTKASNKLISSYLKDKDTLRDETKAWLEIPIGSWTQKNISKGRFLIREWSELTTRNSGDYTLKEQAVVQTQIIRRWMEERQADKGRSNSKSLFQTQIKGKQSNSDSREMVEMLNRCLDSWRKASATTAKKSWKNKTPQAEAMQLAI